MTYTVCRNACTASSTCCENDCDDVLRLPEKGTAGKNQLFVQNRNLLKVLKNLTLKRPFKINIINGF